MVLRVYGGTTVSPPAGWTILSSQEATSPAYGTSKVVFARKDTVTSGNSSTAYTWSFSPNSAYCGTYFVVRPSAGRVVVDYYWRIAENVDLAFDPMYAYAPPPLPVVDSSVLVFIASPAAVLTSSHNATLSDMPSGTLWHSAYTWNFLNCAYVAAGTSYAWGAAPRMLDGTSVGGNAWTTLTILLSPGVHAGQVSDTVTSADTSRGQLGYTVKQDAITDYIWHDDVASHREATIETTARLWSLVDTAFVTAGTQTEIAETFTVGHIDRSLEEEALPIVYIWGLRASYGLRRSETVTAADVAAAKPRWGYHQRDVIEVNETLVPNARYSMAASGGIKASELVRVALPAAMAQSVTVAAATRAMNGVLVLERLALTDLARPTARYGAALVQALTMHDALARFFGAEVAEGISIAPAQASVYRGHAGVADTLAISAALGHSLILKVTVPEGIDITPAQAVKMVFRPTLHDGVMFDAVYVHPNGTITTWAVNTRTNAVTEYTGYNFNSFAPVGLRYLAAADTGLYVLDGATDANDAIIADIKTGLAQFAGSRFTAIKAVYLGIRATGEFALKIIDGANVERTYKVLVDGRRTAKVQVGKGIRTRYMAFELVSTGQDFDLDTIEIIPLLETRRV